MGRLSQPGLGERHDPGPLNHLGLLGHNRYGEALDPVGVDTCLGRHLGDGAAGAEVGLDLPRRQAAVATAVAGPLFVALLALVAVAQAFGLSDGRQQLLVERDHVAAGLRPLARAEDEAVMFCREPDEVDFLHARSLQPVVGPLSLRRQ